MNIINKLFLVTNTTNKNLFFITIAIILTSLADILSIGLIFPYTRIILDDYTIFQNYEIINNFLSNKSICDDRRKLEDLYRCLLIQLDQYLP